MKSFPILFVDNFFPDIDYVLNIAQTTEYERKRLSATGQTSKLSVEELEPNLNNFITEKIMSIFWPPNDYQHACNIQTDFQKIDSYKVDDPTFNRGSIHCDDVFGCDLFAIIYLSKHEDQDSGTSFYERNPNVFLQSHTYVKDFQDALQAYNEDKQITEERKNIFDNFYSYFKETARIQNKQNRAVIFPSSYWHAATGFTEETRYTLRFLSFSSTSKHINTNNFSLNPLDRVN